MIKTFTDTVTPAMQMKLMIQAAQTYDKPIRVSREGEKATYRVDDLRGNTYVATFEGMNRMIMDELLSNLRQPVDSIRIEES